MFLHQWKLKKQRFHGIFSLLTSTVTLKFYSRSVKIVDNNLTHVCQRTLKYQFYQCNCLGQVRAGSTQRWPSMTAEVGHFVSCLKLLFSYFHFQFGIVSIGNSF